MNDKLKKQYLHTVVSFLLGLFIIGFGIFGAGAITFADGTWVKKADLLKPRFGLHADVVDNHIYAIGGRDSVNDPLGGIATGALESYDPETDVWTRKSDMPTARGFFDTAVAAGKIYAIGGAASDYSSLAAVEAFSP